MFYSNASSNRDSFISQDVVDRQFSYLHTEINNLKEENKSLNAEKQSFIQKIQDYEQQINQLEDQNWVYVNQLVEQRERLHMANGLEQEQSKSSVVQTKGQAHSSSVFMYGLTLICNSFVWIDYDELIICSIADMETSQERLPKRRNLKLVKWKKLVRLRKRLPRMLIERRSHRSTLFIWIQRANDLVNKNKYKKKI